jgi:hypothetical protein
MKTRIAALEAKRAADAQCAADAEYARQLAEDFRQDERRRAAAALVALAALGGSSMFGGTLAPSAPSPLLFGGGAMPSMFGAAPDGDPCPCPQCVQNRALAGTNAASLRAALAASFAEHQPRPPVNIDTNGWSKAGVSDGRCTVCWDEPSEILTPCGHAFHRECIEKWFKSGSAECPVCRADCRAK